MRWQEPCYATRVQTCTNAILAITQLHENTSHLEYDAAIATTTKALVQSSKFPSESSEDSIMNMSTSTTSLTPHTVHCLKHSTKYQWNSTEWSAEMKGRECLVPHGETHVFSKILNSNTDRVALSAVFISKPLVFSTLSSVQVIITIAVDQTSSTAP